MENKEQRFIVSNLVSSPLGIDEGNYGIFELLSYCKIPNSNYTLTHVKATWVNEGVKFLCFCLKLYLLDVIIPVSKYKVLVKKKNILGK